MLWAIAPAQPAPALSPPPAGAAADSAAGVAHVPLAVHASTAAVLAISEGGAAAGDSGRRRCYRVTGGAGWWVKKPGQRGGAKASRGTQAGCHQQDS
eukprot:1156630-Pelagomonas_calceolata.AAC.9